MCNGSGEHPALKGLSDTFYPDYGLTPGGEYGVVREGWNDKITQDEVQALLDENRLFGFKDRVTATFPEEVTVTAEEVNRAQKAGGIGCRHDALNRGILIRARGIRLGLIGPEEKSDYCPECKGQGYMRTGPDRLVLHLWMLHPRKGAGRGITIKNVQFEDLTEVKEMLRCAYGQHTKHFAWALED